MINHIVTLENDERYVIIAQTEYNGSKYYYLVGVTEDGEELVNKVKFVEDVSTAEALKLKIVKDFALIDQIKSLLAKDLEKNEFK